MKEVKPYQSGCDKKTQVENMFDSIAPKYDFLNRLFSMRIDVLWRKKLVEWIKEDKPKSILDVATGTGDLAIALQKGIEIDVVAVDLSQQMLNVAKRKVRKLGLDKKIIFKKADAENLPFESNKYDVVSVAFGVRNFENLAKGLTELKRVVKENGSVYILEFSKIEGILAPFYRFYFKKIMPFIGRLVSRDESAYTYLPNSVELFPYGEKMKKILIEIGFREVEYKKMSLGIVTIYKAKK